MLKLNLINHHRRWLPRNAPLAVLVHGRQSPQLIMSLYPKGSLIYSALGSNRTNTGFWDIIVFINAGFLQVGSGGLHWTSPTYDPPVWVSMGCPWLAWQGRKNYILCSHFLQNWRLKPDKANLPLKKPIRHIYMAYRGHWSIKLVYYMPL